MLYEYRASFYRIGVILITHKYSHHPVLVLTALPVVLHACSRNLKRRVRVTNRGANG